MRGPGGRVLVPLLIAAALSGCSGSGPSASPSTGSQGGASPAATGLDGGSQDGQGPPPTGTVTGHVFLVGGPVPGQPRAVKGGGTVVFTGTPTVHAPVNTHGLFSVHLAPGTYRVSATSPDYVNGQAACEARQPVRVTDGGRAWVKIYCQLR
jgi:hypothetical protein